ncbi:3-methylitaconate isomerase [Lachnellula subtilissima]|uniref:3-methylitaconate isomerase n=1 Tax=Lachnellula subtilissima TaxID=602034 RepID=A0A8H8UD31_9HELO|nr:3-methylitaconate isomerase [Lachnellula subtilissima]
MSKIISRPVRHRQSSIPLLPSLYRQTSTSTPLRRQNRLPASYYRGGTSRAIIFSASSLPSNHTLWPPIFLSILGSPDPHGRQLDGLGGGISSLSKICIVGPSPHPAADVDYTFAAIGIRDSEVDFSSNCGNMTSAIGPFAVDNGMVDVGDGESDVTVRIRNTNTGKFIHARFAVVNGEAAAGGGFEIDGVVGKGGKVQLSFIDPAGSKTGKLLPTGNVVDVFDGVRATCIDAGNPCVFVQAEDMDIEGMILPDEIDASLPLLSKLDSIRRKAAVAMGLCQDEASAPGSIPKIAMVSRPKTHTLLSGETIEQEKVDLVVRALSVGQPHRAVPITVAMAIAAAANLEGSTVQGKVSSERVDPDGITLGHPSGKLMVGAKFDEKGHLLQADVFRTARRLMDGLVYWK